MFTYGAVATSKSPLEDLSQPSRNFRGLRCYTETILAATRQADIAAIFETDLYHARVPTLALHWKKDSDYFPGEGRPDLPKHVEGRHGDIDHHDMRHYIDRLSHLHLNHVDVSKKDPFNLGTQFAYMAWGAYEKQKYWVSHKDVTMEQLIKKHLPHWRLVEHVQQDTLEAVDNLWLVQNSQSLDCLLAFEGTHTFEEFFRNLEGSNGGYCGFSDVHHGYADKLYWLMKLSMPKLRSSLSKCNKAVETCGNMKHHETTNRRLIRLFVQVMCTGHSLGGSLCEATGIFRRSVDHSTLPHARKSNSAGHSAYKSTDDSSQGLCSLRKLRENFGRALPGRQAVNARKACAEWGSFKRTVLRRHMTRQQIEPDRNDRYAIAILSCSPCAVQLFASTATLTLIGIYWILLYYCW